MQATLKRPRVKQLTLFQLHSTTLRWEDLPSPVRAELVRLIASLLLGVRARAGNQAGASAHE